MPCGKSKQKRGKKISMNEIFLNWKGRLLDKGKSSWLILLLAGILLLVIAMPASSDTAADSSVSDFSWTKEDSIEKTLLEEKLASLLESVEGVGAVQVMIMTGEEDSDGFYSSGTEKVTGVLVSAEGANRSVIVKNIQDAVMALFQVDAHKIKVMKMK